MVQMLLTATTDLTLPALVFHANGIMDVAPLQASIHSSDMNRNLEVQHQRSASSEEMMAL